MPPIPPPAPPAPPPATRMRSTSLPAPRRTSVAPPPPEPARPARPSARRPAAPPSPPPFQPPRPGAAPKACPPCPHCARGGRRREARSLLSEALAIERERSPGLWLVNALELSARLAAIDGRGLLAVRLHARAALLRQVV